MAINPITVTLFVPCLVDNFFPEIAHAALRTLEKIGYQVRIIEEPICCGQPAFNSGFNTEAAQVAKRAVTLLQGSELIVALSGSCTVMLKKWVPQLLAQSQKHGASLAGTQSTLNVFEFLEFMEASPQLANYLANRQQDTIKHPPVNDEAKLGYHQSCHCYRELGQRIPPVDFIKQLTGREVFLPSGEPECCGFGGTFSIKMSKVAARMSNVRLRQFVELGVDTIVTADPGCIFQLRKEIKAQNFKLNVAHISQIIDHYL